MIKYFVIDVDGTLTDGGVYYDDNGNELKKFCTKDGAGFVAARAAGIKLIVLTGRECPATTRRMTELHVDKLVQNIKDKVEFLSQWILDKRREEVCYIGDDINDLGAMRMCGFVACPADAAPDVKAIANYVSSVNGGHGAVRDVIEHYMKAEGIWEEAVNKAYGAGV